MVIKEDRCGVGLDWSFGIGIHIPLCMEWMVNSDLLYSTGKSTQYPVITYMGMDMCTCITESFCYTAEINIVNQLYFNKIFSNEKNHIKSKVFEALLFNTNERDSLPISWTELRLNSSRPFIQNIRTTLLLD